MQKGLPTPSDAGVVVWRKHININHEGGFQELSLVQMFLEMNNRFLWEPPCSAKSRSSLGLIKATGQSDLLQLQAGQEVKVTAGVTQIWAVLAKFCHVIHTEVLSPQSQAHHAATHAALTRYHLSHPLQMPLRCTRQR